MKGTTPRPRRDAGRPRGAPIAEAVLAHTLAELAAVGVEGLSVERIARAADVNKTSIYRRWPTREALVAAALEGVAAQVTAQLPDTGTLRGDLIALVVAVAGLFATPLGRGLLRAALTESAAEEVAALAARQLGRGGHGLARTVVARARSRGEWADGARGEVVVNALVGAVIHRAVLERGALDGRWRGALVDAMLYGALPRPARGDAGAGVGRGASAPAR
ncbi:MAG: TetR/AcrR family transcriptional regulator [Deltaproteobacteria bacterium]|nr:TetR/AcrR family transcriptional regulator [Myxococcales bacterium]MDP3220220.1 TetR/AcrR family transcriptional regulator [Deltaproteobacteria bacterium]